MKITDFNKIYDFIKKDKIVYFLLLKNNNDINPKEETKILTDYLKKFPQLFLSPNINTHNEGERISFQSFPKKGLGNCLIVRLETLLPILEKFNMDLDVLLADKSILKKSIKSTRKQEDRKREKNKQCGKSKESEIIIYGDTKKNLTNWAKKNQVSAIKSITLFENKVYKALKNTFKNRLKRQQPFIIDGKVYYTDFCIKSKKVIIEIDGGYHSLESQKIKDKDRDAAFKSIGYEVIRINNSDTNNPKVLKELRARLIMMSKK